MKMNYFVSGSSLVLAGWLAMTFFHEVSPQEYPKQRRGSVPAQALNAPAAKPVAHAPKAMAKGAAALATARPQD